MKKILLLLSLCFVFSSGFATAEQSKDPEIVAFMIVLNKNEIAAADLTKLKKVNKQVNNYADLMLKDHNKNLIETENLSVKQQIKPIYTEAIVALKDKGKVEMDTLTPLVDKTYEAVYIDAMVKGHTEALASINSFLKEVKNSKLKTHLKNTRVQVQHHLAKAKEIKKEFNL